MIAVEHLVKDYGSFRAVDGVSFTVSPGEVCGFLGPNGAGKSTTMKILSGYLSATSGKATVASHDVAAESLEVRRVLGYLAEHNALYTDMLVSEYVKFVGSMRGLSGAKRRTRVDEVVQTCNLEEYYYRPIGTLSKGFRQRVGLAAAMVHDPQVLILDEPTSGLDPIEIKKIRELIRMLGKTKTVILSTHILQEVEATCDRVILIARGTIIADGTPESVCRDTTDELKVRVAFLDGKSVKSDLGKLEGVDAVEELPKHGGRQRYLLRGAPDAKIELAVNDFARSKDLQVAELAPEATTLEEAFAKLVLASESRRPSSGLKRATKGGTYAADAGAKGSGEEKKKDEKEEEAKS